MALVESEHLLRVKDEGGDHDMLSLGEESERIICSRRTFSSASTKDEAISKAFSIQMFPCSMLAHWSFSEIAPLDVDSGSQMLNLYGRDGKMTGKIQVQTSGARATSNFLDVKLWVKGNNLPLLSCSVSRNLLSSIAHLPRTPSQFIYHFVVEKLPLKHVPLLQCYNNDNEWTRIKEESYVCDNKNKLEQLKQLKREMHHAHNEVKKAKRSNIKVQQELGRQITSLETEIDNLKEKLSHQTSELKSCREQVLELKGNIRVFCRCRPLTANEVRAGGSSVIEFSPLHNQELYVHTHDGVKKTFKFDQVFTPSHTQEEVFLEIAPLVVSVLDGFNVCIFAYGQTGTGKTFTMEGSADNRGVNYRTLEKLFELASQRKGQCTYEISVSVLEVYNEEIRDLLISAPSLGHNSKKLEIRQVADGRQHVPGAVEAPVYTIEEVWKVLQIGSRARVVGSTNANKHSSRSHCLLCVMVKGENLLTNERTESKLWLIDLAGSERIGKTDVCGEQLKEAQNINKSLSALGDVIHALSSKNSHIPYRNSKITHLLQDSLGGQSKTLMFVQISPSEQDVGETLCSLNFASRVRGIELGAARKQLDPAELFKFKKMVEKSREDGCKKEAMIVELQAAVKLKEQTYKALSVKVKETEGLLQVERKSRVTAEEKVKEQHTVIDKQRLMIEKLSAELRAEQSSLLLEPVEQKIPSASTPRRPPLQERLTNNREQTAMQQTKKRAAEGYVQKENVCNGNVVDTDILLAKHHPRRVSMSTMQRQGPSTPAAIPLPKRRAILREDSCEEELLRSGRRGRASLCALPQRQPSQWAFPVASPQFAESRTRLSMVCPVDPTSLEVAESMQATITSCRSCMAAPQRRHLSSPQPSCLSEPNACLNGGELKAGRVSNFNNVNVARGKPPQHPYHQAVNKELHKRMIGENGHEVGHPLNKIRRLSAATPSLPSNWAPSTPASAAPRHPPSLQPRNSMPWAAAFPPSTPAHHQPLIGAAQRVPLPLSHRKARQTAWNRFT